MEKIKKEKKLEEKVEEKKQNDSQKEWEKFGLPQKLYLEALKKANEKKLNKKEIEEFMQYLKEKYDEAKVEEGEAVGIIAAQSLGEPGTQLTLRTKHYAGAIEVSVGSGIQRVEEIVDGRSKAKYPTMTIYLKPEIKKDKEKVEEFAKSLVEVTVNDVVKTHENFFDKTLQIIIDKEKAKEHGLKPKEVFEKLNDMFGKAQLKTDKAEMMIKFPKNYSLTKIRRMLLKALKKKIRGIAGIQKTVVLKEDNEFIIKTSGSNLKSILRLPEVDAQRTITNDIVEISKVLGIEAARKTIIQELYKTLSENNIKIDIRHIMLLADLITFSGEIKGTIRTGIMKEKKSVLARATFEETVSHLLQAAIYDEVEELKGVIENIIVGRPIKVGTGVVKVIMKE